MRNEVSSLHVYKQPVVVTTEEDTDGERYHARGILPSHAADRRLFRERAVGDRRRDEQCGCRRVGADARPHVVATRPGLGLDGARRTAGRVRDLCVWREGDVPAASADTRPSGAAGAGCRGDGPLRAVCGMSPRVLAGPARVGRRRRRVHPGAAGVGARRRRARDRAADGGPGRPRVGAPLGDGAADGGDRRRDDLRGPALAGSETRVRL